MSDPALATRVALRRPTPADATFYYRVLDLTMREHVVATWGQLFILPAHQGQGVGRHLVENLIAEAAHAGLPIRLRVLRVNPARLFYEKLGFVVTESTPERSSWNVRRETRVAWWLLRVARSPAGGERRVAVRRD
jgi:GNAT superfamily N-acetyltransferase